MNKERFVTMKRLKFILLSTVIVGALFLGSCLKDDGTEYPVGAGLTMVNAFSSSAPVAYRLENRWLTSGMGLDYRVYAQVFDIFPGTRRLLAQQYGDGATLVDTVYTFKDSTFYSSFLYRGVEEDEIRHLIMEDHSLELAGEESGVRFLHVASEVGSVNVYFDTTEEPVFADRSLEQGAEGEEHDRYDFIASGSGTKKIIVTGDGGEVLVERDYEFGNGYVYSIMLMGSADSEEYPLYIGVVSQYRSAN